MTEKGWYVSAEPFDKAAKECRRAINLILKGPDEELMEPFIDGAGHVRRFARVAWWNDNPTTYGEAYVNIPSRLMATLLPTDWKGRQSHIRTEMKGCLRNLEPHQHIFIGHYGQKGMPAPLADNVVCVDWCANERNQLVAYRVNNMATRPSADKFFWSSMPYPPN